METKIVYYICISTKALRKLEKIDIKLVSEFTVGIRPIGRRTVCYRFKNEVKFIDILRKLIEHKIRFRATATIEPNIEFIFEEIEKYHIK